MATQVHAKKVPAPGTENVAHTRDELSSLITAPLRHTRLNEDRRSIGATKLRTGDFQREHALYRGREVLDGISVLGRTFTSHIIVPSHLAIWKSLSMARSTRELP